MRHLGSFITALVCLSAVSNAHAISSTALAPVAVSSTEETDLFKRGEVRLVSFTSQRDDKQWAAANLFGGQANSRRHWASVNNPSYPQEFTLELPGNRSWLVRRLEIDPATPESPEHWGREVSLWVGNSQDGPWLPMGHFNLEAKKGLQGFPLAAKAGSFVLLRVESNGGGSSVELGEVRLIGRPAGTESAREEIPAMPPPPQAEVGRPVKTIPFFAPFVIEERSPSTGGHVPTPQAEPPKVPQKNQSKQSPPSSPPAPVNRELEDLAGKRPKITLQESGSGMSVRGDEPPPEMQKSGGGK